MSNFVYIYFLLWYNFTYESRDNVARLNEKRMINDIRCLALDMINEYSKNNNISSKVIADIGCGNGMISTLLYKQFKCKELWMYEPYNKYYSNETSNIHYI